jgi:SAM-dependent methyltransferase
MDTSEKISTAVRRLYDTYPFPPEPLLDEPPPGYNWRWNWLTAYEFCTGTTPPTTKARILDAGCGTGVGTEYLVHLNPEAQVVAVDLSAGALEVAKERCRRSGADRVEFHHLSLYDVDRLPGEFDLINCVGVLHHLPDPVRGIQSLAAKLAPGGIMHIFVYGELGRWEIGLMQEAIALVQGDKRGDYIDGVKVGRSIFAALPENNRLVRREKERWSLENHRDESFADMYVHPQEIDYNISTLFELIDASGLEFVGFSNPNNWDLERILGNNTELIARIENMSDRQKYRLAELLDPESFSHYEFFLAKPPLCKIDWSDDRRFLAAIPQRNPCLEGWPARSVFNPDYQLVNLSPAEYEFLARCDSLEDRSGDRAKRSASDRSSTIAELMQSLDLDLPTIRSLHQKRLILLSDRD